MYKSLITFLFIAFLISCANNNTADNTTEQKNTETASQPAEDAEATKGLDLMANSDCLTCHKVSEMSTGPSYEAIAAKYPLNEQTYDTLTLRIINGSQGVWGQVPMSAHADLSEQDARAMVKYIMSLKK